MLFKNPSIVFFPHLPKQKTRDIILCLVQGRVFVRVYTPSLEILDNITSTHVRLLRESCTFVLQYRSLPTVIDKVINRFSLHSTHQIDLWDFIASPDKMIPCQRFPFGHQPQKRSDFQPQSQIPYHVPNNSFICEIQLCCNPIDFPDLEISITLLSPS